MYIDANNENPKKKIENFNFWSVASRKTENSRFWPEMELKTTFSWKNRHNIPSTAARIKNKPNLEMKYNKLW